MSFRCAEKLFRLFTSALKIILSLGAVSGILILRLLMLPAIAQLAGFLSALFWFWSAVVSIPKSFPVVVVIGGGLGGVLGGGPLGGGKVAVGSSPNLTILGEQLAWQSQLNKYAAICAGLA